MDCREVEKIWQNIYCVTYNFSKQFPNPRRKHMAQVTTPTAQPKTTFFQPQESVGAALEKALALGCKTLSETLSSEHGEARNALLSAAEQTIRLIGTLRVAYDYQRILATTCEKVDATTKGQLACLGDLCAGLEAKDVQGLRSKTPVNLTFKDKFIPTVEKISPPVTVVTKDADQTTLKVDVTISGNFPRGAEQKWDHSLTFMNKKYEPISRSVTELKYSLEIPAQEGYSLLEGTLNVAWSTSAVFYSWTTSQFPCQIPIRVLPPSLGTIKAVYSKTTEETRTVWSDLVKHEREDGLCFLKPTEGWQLKSGTAHVSYPLDPGTNKVFCTGQSAQQMSFACKRDTLYQRPDFFQVSATETKPTTTERTEEHDAMKWGTEVTLTPKTGEKLEKIVLTTWNNQVLSATPKTLSSEWLEFHQEQDGSLRIKAKELKDLN
jgi:hypothetical protein